MKGEGEGAPREGAPSDCGRSPTEAMKGEEDRPGKSPWVIAGQLTAVAFEFIGSVLAGAVAGYFGDRRLGTEPWLLIAFTLFGTGGGFYQMIRMLRHFEKNG